jgi:dihydropteroate synthase
MSRRKLSSNPDSEGIYRTPFQRQSAKSSAARATESQLTRESSLYNLQILTIILIEIKMRRLFELDLMGKRLRLGERTLIMGILNITADSFSDGGCFLDPDLAVAHGVELVRQGTDWIDVGGESTRPGSIAISAEEEAARVLPVIRALRRRLPSVPISIDTTKALVAERATEAGANIINDVSGLRFDLDIARVARRRRTLLILMHLRGRPQTMQQKPFARSIWRSLQDGLEGSIRRALQCGVRRSQLIIDPGLGFGKSRSQNLEILKHLERLERFSLPVLVGSSRKSFVRAVAGVDRDAVPRRRSGRVRTADDDSSHLVAVDPVLALQIGDAAAVTASILNSAHIIRVHDVKHIIPAVRIADAILNPARAH